MYIQSQDKDTIFTLSDKGILKGCVFTKDHYIDGQFYGTNIYGKTLLKTVLLGTYEPEEAEQIVKEIYRLLRKGMKFYVMPESADIPEVIEYDF